MSVAAIDAPGRVVMHGVSWQTYEALLDALEQQHVRVAYDRGKLELMSPTRLHERLKRLVNLLVGAISREFGIPIQGFGSATFRRADLDRGVEADEWFYVASEPAIRGKDEVDLDVDPPPDLAIEIDITTSVEERLPIYSALGVPEIWVWRAGTVRFLFRNNQGAYAELPNSRAFRFLGSAVLTHFLAQRRNTDEATFVNGFIQQLRNSSSKSH